MVGLGNPGADYAHTRHNIGFVVVSLLAARWGASPQLAAPDALVAEARLLDQQVCLLWPQAFMNRSGTPVASFCAATACPPERVLVVHDDLDLPFGLVRCKSRGGHGGHNGLRDLIGVLGRDFPRVRVGIGRPPPGVGAADHVLGRWSPAESEHLERCVQRAADAAEMVLTEGAAAAMNLFNARQLYSGAPSETPAKSTASS